MAASKTSSSSSKSKSGASASKRPASASSKKGAAARGGKPAARGGKSTVAAKKTIAAKRAAPDTYKSISRKLVRVKDSLAKMVVREAELTLQLSLFTPAFTPDSTLVCVVPLSAADAAQSDLDLSAPSSSPVDDATL